MKQVCRDPETKQGRAAVGCTDDQFWWLSKDFTCTLMSKPGGTRDLEVQPKSSFIVDKQE